MELNSILMQRLSFVLVEKHSNWSHERKHAASKTRKSVSLACVAAGCVTKSRYSPSAQRLPKACSDTPRMDTRIFVSISDWLVSYAPYDWSYSCKISKYKYCHALIVFSFKARPCFAFEKIEKAMSDSSGYCNLCCRVIEERNECYSQRDGNNSTSSPRLKVWKYLCDRPKRSTFAETVLQNWKNVDHLSSKQKNWKQNWKALVQAKIRFHSNEIIAVHNLLDYFDVLFVSNRDCWHSHVVYMPNLVFHQRSQRRYGNENTGTTRLFEQSIRSDRKALENQRFAVACRQIYKNILTHKKFAKRIFLFRWKIIDFKLLSHGFERFCQDSSVVADILFPTQSRFDV